MIRGEMQMTLSIAETMARRIRIRSWKDLVLVIVAALVIYGVQWVLKKLFPNMPDKAVSVISYGIGIVIIVVGVFAIRE